MTQIWQENDCVILDNGLYRSVIVPTQGGKVKSFQSLSTGREFLYQDLRQTYDASGYEGADHSGWDECFPNIRPCTYPIGLNGGKTLPDHGFLWSTDCSFRIEGSKVTLFADFPAFNVTLERTYTLKQDLFTIDYKLINHGHEPFVYLTAAHILFQWEDGLQADLPEEADFLYVYRSSDSEKIRPGTWVKSNFWNNGVSNYNSKLFTPPLNRGNITLHYTGGNWPAEKLDILFDPADLPYAGLWIAKQWRDEFQNIIHCFSIQPTNWASATLPTSEWLGSCPVIPAKAVKTWAVSLKATIH